MSDISLTSTDYQVEKRSWILSQFGQNPGENPSVVLDQSAFTAGTHFPNGFFPSGTLLGKITALSTATKTVVGPYDNTATDGREVFFGFLHSSVRVPTNGSDPGGAAVVAGFIKLSKLPITLDAAGQADAKLCHFVA